MIAILHAHRRLTELYLKAKKLGGYDRLTLAEQFELTECMKINADFVQRMDGLKELSFVAYQAGDVEWQQELCLQIDQLEANFR